MKTTRTLIYALLIGAASAFSLCAQNPTTEPEGEEPEEIMDLPPEEGGETDAQLDERLNPFIDIDVNDEEIDIPIPAFIKRGNNRIIFNGADWSALRRSMASTKNKPVSIVHIGDSHVQADMATGVTRDLLQYDFGNAGRGLVTPLKLAGTNQPVDYTFSSPDNWSHVKLMSRTWNNPMGFTGVSIHPLKQNSSITLATSETEDYNPFSSVILFHGGKMNVTDVRDEQGVKINYRAIPSRDYTQLVFAEPQTRVTVDFASKGDLTLYGASLAGQRPGVYYHAIGNNGAAYATYNRIGNVGVGIRPLEPQLVIISLGTNEAFGRLDTTTFYQSIDRLVKNIQANNPQAQILLVTPMECQKAKNSTVKKKVKNKKRKGRKQTYRTVNSTVKTYAPNPNIRPLRDEILRYGRDNGVAVLDWYDVAGGDGASNTWINAGLYSRDKVHHTAKGYRIQGRLLYEALIDALANAN